jgi:hypothetical protein
MRERERGKGATTGSTARGGWSGKWGQNIRSLVDREITTVVA